MNGGLRVDKGLKKEGRRVAAGAGGEATGGGGGGGNLNLG